MHENLAIVPTKLLVLEAARLERKLLLGTSTAIETELYCLIQVELGGRLAREMVLDPRD
ncbi:MAG: hypothetical protein GX560_00240 [Deinococcales bacterium]|nr:hypothetical protein [Deinococcales bacterium]